jgi:hypothetical protein
MFSKFHAGKTAQFKAEIDVNSSVPFTKFTTRKWVVLTSKIDKLFGGFGVNP